MIAGALLWGVLWVLGFALLAFAAILCAPVILGVDFNTAAKPGIAVKVSLFGGLCPAFSMSDKRGKTPSEETKEPAERQQQKKSKRSNMAAYALDMARAAPRFISEIAARMKIETMVANISFGLPDPADTGVVYGALSPVLRLFDAAPAFHIAFQPDFNETSFRGSGRFAVRFTPIALAPPAFGFGWAAFVSPRLSKAFR